MRGTKSVRVKSEQVKVGKSNATLRVAAVVTWECADHRLGILQRALVLPYHDKLRDSGFLDS